MYNQYDSSESDAPTYDPQTPPPTAPKDPWTADELSQSQSWANQYYTSHQIPVGYGTADDLGNAYLAQRRNGVGHQAAMDAAPGALGWDKYTPPPKKAVDAPNLSDPATWMAMVNDPSKLSQWVTSQGVTDPNLVSYYIGQIQGKPGANATEQAGGAQYWTDRILNPNGAGGGSGGGTPPLAPLATTVGSGAASGGTIPPPNTTVPASPNQSQSDALYEYLMGKARQSETVNPNDPLIRTQSDNYSANLTRTGRQYLSELAERKGAGGNIGAESRMVAEKNAQAGAAHEGDLLQHESDQRRQEIEQALALGAQYMTAQQQRDLQAELAKIDANTRVYQTQVQDQQFGRNLDLGNRTLAQGQGQFDRNMTQREREFNDNLRQRAYEFDTTDEYNRSPYAHPGA